MFGINNSFQAGVSRNTLEALYTDAEIYTRYYPDFELTTVKSIFHEENSPSMSFFERESRIYWKEHSLHLSGDVYSFVEHWYRLRNITLTFNELLHRIYEDMKTADIDRSPILFQNDPALLMTNEPGPVSSKRMKTLIQVVRPVNTPFFTYPYWEDQHISRNVLRFYEAGLAEEVWITKMIRGQVTTFLWGRSEPDDPIYFFYFEDTGHFKCYRPLTKDKKKKWISNVDGKVDIQGLKQLQLPLRRPPVIVITKSMKDVMLLRTFGIDAIAPHGEGHYFDADFIAYLRRHCDLLISLYDNDWPGRKGGITLRKMYDIPDFYIDRMYGCKDASDLNVAYSHALFSQIELLFRHLKIYYDIRTCSTMGIGHSPRTSTHFIHADHRRR